MFVTRKNLVAIAFAIYALKLYYLHFQLYPFLLPINFYLYLRFLDISQVLDQPRLSVVSEKKLWVFLSHALVMVQSKVYCRTVFVFSDITAFNHMFMGCYFQ